MFVTYPAIFLKEENNEFTIMFPGFEGGTCGKDINDGYRMAIDWLGINLMDYFIAKKPLPTPLKLEDVETKNYLDDSFSKEEKDYYLKNSFKTLIGFDLSRYMRDVNKKTVRKNVTIPSWMNEAAKNYNINFSKLLKEALEREFDIED